MFYSKIFSNNVNSSFYIIQNPKYKYKNVCVDKNFKTITTSDATSRIIVESDLFTNEPKIITKISNPIFESPNKTFYDEKDSYKDYIGKDNTIYECFDLTGKNLNIDKKIEAIINDNIILSNGEIYNLINNKKSKLQNLNNKSDEIYVHKFNDYILIDEVWFNEYESTDPNGTTYKDSTPVNDMWIYNNNLNFIKTINGFGVNDIYDYNNDGVFDYAKIGKYDTLGNGGEEYIGCIYDLLNKNLEKIVNDNNCERIDFESDYAYIDENRYFDLEKGIILSRDEVFKTEDLEYTNNQIFYNKKEIVINDVLIDACEIFNIANQQYLLIKSKGEYYIYNLEGKKIKSLPLKDYTSAFNIGYYIANLNDEFIVFEPIIHNHKVYSLGKVFAEIYDNNFSNVATLKIGKDFQIKQLFNGKLNYISLGKDENNKSFGEMITGKNFNILYDSNRKKFKFVRFDENLFYLKGEINKIINENGSEIMDFDKVIVNVCPITSNHKKYYSIVLIDNNSKIIESLYDKDFNFVIDNIDFANTNYKPVHDVNDMDYKILFVENDCFINKKENAFDIYDENFNIMDSFKLKSKDATLVDELDKNLIICKNADNDYSLYKINEGFVLEDYYYLNSFNEDFLIFCKDNKYGLMDTNLNLLCQFSV